MPPFNQTASSVKLQDQRCLLTTIPEHAQYTLRDVTNFVILPLDTLLALLSFTFNSVILLAVLRRRAIQSPSLLFLCSLSTSDAIWAMMSGINNAKFFIFRDFCPKKLTTEEVFAAVLCFYSTLGSLAVISSDRLLAVSNPWWYRSHVKRSLAIKQIILVWAIGAILSVIGALLWRNYSPFLWFILLYLGAAFSFCYVLTIIACHIGILVASCRHRASMHSYAGPMRTVLERERKVANTVGLILLVLCFTLLPGVIAPNVMYLLVDIPKRDDNPLRAFYHIFFTLNGLVNPLVYYGRNEDIRRAVHSLMRYPRCCREVRQVGDVNNSQLRRNLFPLRRNNSVSAADSH